MQVQGCDCICGVASIYPALHAAPSTVTQPAFAAWNRVTDAMHLGEVAHGTDSLVHVHHHATNQLLASRQNIGLDGKIKQHAPPQY